ncbi:aminotransferase class V-fold PLP-dependent enzyme [Olsenella sp. KGMB02461]|nr:aminotransferase class V-fold PLP-dependent enzyme [Olsenella sp. KGMB02461]
MTVSSYVYLDYAASAPLRPEAVAARAAYEALPCACANPNSLHTLGRQAASHLEQARRTLAKCLGGGVRPMDVAFAGGGTEANNLAVIGLAEGCREAHPSRRRVLLGATEHDSVLDLVSPLKARGFEVSLVAPHPDGSIDAASLESYLADDVALVSLMAANNETGVVAHLPELAAAIHGAGALFHSDAIQAFGRIPLDLSGVDAVTLAGHKIGAPVGTAAFAIKTRTPYRPQSFGGGQEGGRRPGTQDVAGACALAATAAYCTEHLSEVRPLVASRARHVYQRLCAPGTHIVPTAGTAVGDDRLPGVVSVMVESFESEQLILELDNLGYEVSAGSACSSSSLDPSHVLSAMGIGRTLALGSLRISFDERVSLEELDGFCDALLAVVAKAHPACEKYDGTGTRSRRGSRS